MDVDSVCKLVLRRIVPKREEREHTAEICKKIMDVAEQNCQVFNAKPMFCGSIAKGTWLAGHKDLDLFLLFKGISPKKLEEHGLILSKAIVKDLQGSYTIAYAEHPYVRAKIMGYDIDIVPAFDTKDKIRSSVDRTPWHVRWVLENLDPGLRNEVRLLKRFCKGIGIYGSDLKTEGLSGYLCELLIAEYGFFKSFLKAARFWDPGHVIDPAKHWKKFGLLRKRFKTPLIVIDPVDRNRNVASVLSAENFFRLVRNAEEFLRNPAEHFFFPAPRKDFGLDKITTELKRRGTEFILISFPAPDVLPDVLWPQLRRAATRLEGFLAEFGFQIVRSDVWSDGQTAIIILELSVPALPAIHVKIGPSIFDEKNSRNFIKRYAGCNLFVRGQRWVAEAKRQYETAIDALRDLFSLNAAQMQEAGIPGNLARKLEHELEVASGQDTLRIFRRHPGLREFMAGYFEKNIVPDRLSS